MSTDVTIRYAQTDQDVIHIHQFLVVVAGPTLPGPIGAIPSLSEVLRVCAQEVGLMAMRNDRLIGTMGIMRTKFWWSDDLHYLVNRWFFGLPGEHAGKPLLKEALSIAVGASLELHIIAEARGTVTILNKSPNRTPSSNQ